MKSKFFHFSLLLLTYLVSCKTTLSNPRSQKCTHISSNSFIILSFTFRSMIHFELIFLYDVRKGYNCIYLHTDIQLSQHHLLIDILFPLNSLGTFVKINNPYIYGQFMGTEFYSINLFVYHLLTHYYTVLNTIA